MLSLLILTAIIAAGWRGATFWLCIPLGYAAVISAYWGRRELALREAKWLWLSAPLTALAIMWLAAKAHGLLLN